MKSYSTFSSIMLKVKDSVSNIILIQTIIDDSTQNF